MVTALGLLSCILAIVGVSFLLLKHRSINWHDNALVIQFGNPIAANMVLMIVWPPHRRKRINTPVPLSAKIPKYLEASTIFCKRL